MRRVAFLLPHETLNSVVPVGDEQSWAALDCGDRQGFREELAAWAGRTNLDLASGAPVLSIGLWGDSAPLSKRISLLLLTIKAISGPSLKRFWVFACTKKDMCDCGCSGRCTLDACWRIIAWSFQILLSGIWPSADHLGRAWPVGSWRRELGAAKIPMRFRGALLRKSGDWAWFKCSLGLRGWRGTKKGKHMCWICNASFNCTHNCYDFRKEATWRQQLVTMEEIRHELTTARYPSQIWSIPGLTIGSFRPDWMHCADLGITQYCTANIVWELFVEMKGTFTTWKPACAKLVKK